MALDDLKKAILEEAKSEAQKIKSEGKKEADKIKRQWEEKTDSKVKEIISTAESRADKKLQQTRFKIQASNQTEILKQKKKIIDKVYDAVLDKLKNMSEKQYVGLMEKLIKKLPDVGGEIISVKGKTKLLEKALIASNRDYHLSEAIASGSGGFVFRSEKIDISCTFEALMEINRDGGEVLVAEILFSNK